MKRILAAIFVLAGVGPAMAQDDEIVVTGSRIARYESDTVPVVHLKRRADFVVMEATVESDSRDEKLRREEVFKTLAATADRADRDNRIELGILRTIETDDDEISVIAAFDKKMLNDRMLSRGGRADTTKAVIVVKTPVTEADTVDTAAARIEKFIESVPETGRASITGDDDPGLSIVDIGQYRTPLLQAIAADNAAVRVIFGDDYRIAVGGLDEPVRWRITGPLELAIYFPYDISIAQK